MSAGWIATMGHQFRESEPKQIRATMEKRAPGEISTEQLADWAAMLQLHQAYDWEDPEEDEIADWLNEISMLPLKPKAEPD
jgi:hypothetical protein